MRRREGVLDNRLVLPVNTVLDGSYRILRVVGSGGFGVTYEAEDSKLGTSVAIKEYYPVEFGDRDASMNVLPKSERHKQTFDWGRENFLNEARTLARFEHPSIVRVLRVFEANATAYMVMRFEQGQSFEDWLERLGRAPNQAELDSIVSPLLDALETLHAAKLLHRDIAPDNVLIRADGTPVLLDFGAARQSFAEMSRSPGGIIKAGYSPPEQYSLDARLQGPWSDLYALGATFYRAVAGRPPEEATLRVDSDDMPPATSINREGGYRPEFLAGIDACLKVRHSERPQSVALLRPSLLGQKLPPANDRAQERESSTAREPRRKLAARSLVAIIIVVLLSGSAIGFVEFGRWRPQKGTDQSEDLRKALAAAAQREHDLALKLEQQRKLEEERIAREAEEARKKEADRKAELETEKRQTEERAAAEAEAKRLSEQAALVRGLQAGLSRVGCYAGEASGEWNAEERTALEQFAKRTKLALQTETPSDAALSAVVARTERVCPLQCGEGTVESNGKCVPKPPRHIRIPRAVKPAPGGDQGSRSARGGYVTCGRNGCQVVPKGCYAIRHGGGGGLGGRIVCP